MNELCFNYATITTSGNSWHRWTKAIREDVMAGLEEQGGKLYGIWIALFGLASNQLVLMTNWHEEEGSMQKVERTLSAAQWIKNFDHHTVVPTARPKTSEPPRRQGLYVHRWFTVEPRHVQEVVDLSAEAWETFEKTFEVEVVGFFRTVNETADDVQLMLLNWYPNLAAWEKSREFERDNASKQRFNRRFQLSKTTKAIATSIVPTDS